MASMTDATAISEVDMASGLNVGNTAEGSIVHTDYVGPETEVACVVGTGDILDAFLTGAVRVQPATLVALQACLDSSWATVSDVEAGAGRSRPFSPTGFVSAER